MKKLLSIILIAIVAVSAYKFFTEVYNPDSDFLLKTGTNEDRIADTLDKYVEAFNNGDFDTLLKCCGGRYKTDLKSQMGLGSSVFGSLLSHFTSGIFDLGDGALEHLWSLGTANCQMELEIEEIYYLSDTQAELLVNYIEKNINRETPAYMLMEEDDGAWYVASDFYEHSQK